MQVQAIKYGDSWLIKNIPGFENIKSDVVTVNIDLSGDAWSSFDYKELRGIAIMERYYEKQKREIPSSVSVDDLRRKFRKKFDIDSTSLSAFLKGA